MLKLTRALAVLSAIAWFSHAQAAVSLLKDINQGFYPGQAGAGNFVTVNGLTLFVAFDDPHGQELWATDGTSAGTRLVRDIAPGTNGSGIERLTAVNNVLYFFANDGVNGMELWRSDGTLSGTHIVADIRKGQQDSIPEFPSSGPIASIGAVLYFAADDGTGLGLWRSDGTANGTYRVGSVNVLDGFIVAIGQQVYFQGPGSAGGGGELWTSDGTAAGTKQLSNTFPGKPHSGAGQVTATSAGIFFVAGDGTGVFKLVFTKPDGSSLHVVADLTATVPSVGPVFIASLGSDVVLDVDAVGLYHADTNTATLIAPNVHAMSGFQSVGSHEIFSVGSTGAPSVDLWTTDGTSGGTHQLGAAVQLRSEAAIGTQSNPADDGFVYFTGQTGSGPLVYAIWRTDGTDAGTSSYIPQPSDTVLLPQSIVRFQGKIYFDYRCDTNSQCLWASDGTTAGTSAVFNPAPSSIFEILSSGNAMFLLTLGAGTQLYASDGTLAGTHSLVTFSAESQGQDSQANGFTSLGNTVLFVANDGIHGNELWLSDKSTHATSMLIDLNPGAGDGAYSNLLAVSSGIIFGGTDGIHGEQLWVTDGTASGTKVLANISPETDSWNVVMLNGVAFFPADDGVHGFQPWRSDGTAAGTFMAAQIPQESFVSNFRVLNGQVLFYSQSQSQWWVSDATPQGAHAITQPGTASALTATLGGLLYYAGLSNGGITSTLWATDGTVAGTRVALTVPNENISNVYGISNRIILATSNPSLNFRAALYGTDGTSAGTAQISLDSLFAGIAVGGHFFYSTPNSGGGIEVRATDGTAAGTVDLGKFDGVGSVMGAYNGSAIFSAATIVPGSSSVGSLWTSDGTAQGTHLAATGLMGTFFQTIDNAVYFQGTTEATGAEPFVMDALSPNAAPDVAATPAETAVTIDVLANDGYLIAALAPGSVSISVAAANGSTSVDPSSGKITYTPAKGFSGTDTFAYMVMDALGQNSLPTSVDVVVGAEAGPPPGTAPASPTGGSSGGSTGGTSAAPAKGGGGEISLAELFALAGLVWLLRSASTGDAARRRRTTSIS